MKISTCLKSVLMFALTTLSLPLSMSGETVEFNACLTTVVKDGSTTVRAVSMYNISPSGYFTRYASSSGMNSVLGGALVDNIYYEFKTTAVANPTMLQIQKWNYPAFSRNGGVMTCPKVNMTFSAIAYNPVDKLLYGCFRNAGKTGWEFAAIDPAQITPATFSNFNRGTIGTIENKWMAMAFTPQGVLYVLDEAGDLYTANPESGAVTKVGATGLVPANTGSAVVDDRTGELYLSLVTADGAGIYNVDTTTAKATEVIKFPYGEQMLGLHIFRPELPEGVPGYAENVKMAFDKGSRSGKASFTMPAKLYGGDAATGSASYVINIGDKKVAEGTAAYGAEVKDVAVSAEADGAQLAEVIVSNDAGAGPSHKLEVKVGKGTPKAVENLKAVYSQGEFTVTWDPVTESTDGSYVDPEEITYTVTRTPDNELVAENSKETTVKDKVAIPLDPVTYAYSVVASYEDKSSAAATSNGVMLGAIQPPYSCDFATEASAAQYTVLNSNKDVYKWTWTSKGMVLPASNTMDMNDWLITPPLMLKAGHAYLMTLDLQGDYVNVREKFEIKLGASPEESAMNVTVLDATEVIYESKPTQVLVSVKEDGMYYIGIHAISARGSAALYLKDLNIGEPLLLTAPQAVSNLKAVPAPDDSNDVTVSFTTPAKNIGDKDITTLAKVEVFRNNTLVKTYEEPAVNTGLNFKDVIVAPGDVTYDVVPYNSDGKGQSARVIVYAGVNYPGMPGGLEVKESAETEGTVTVSWKAPETDAAGFAINPELVTYDVYSAAAGTRDLLAENVKELTFTHVACEPGAEQKFMQYAVIPKTVRGEGTPAVSTLLPVGTSYELPFSESFSYGSISHIIGTEVLVGSAEYVEWIQCTTGDINNYVASDGDNGFIAHYATYIGHSGRMFTGKIAVDAENPILWFSTNYFTKGHDGIVNVQVKCDGQWDNVNTYRVNEFAEDKEALGWYRAVVDLSAYKGKTIQLGFACETSNYTHILLDDIRLYDAKKSDLALVDLNAPLTVEAGKEYSMSLAVENHGVNEVASHDVEITLNGTTVATAKGDAVKPGRKQVHEFKFTLPVNVAVSNDLQATVKAASDEHADNNTHTPLKVNIAAGAMPSVKNLKAVNNQGEVTVTWDAAETTGTPVCRDSFEDMTSWDNTGSDWSFVDADQAPITGISGLDLPNVAPKSKQSWWAMDSKFDKIAAEIDFKAKSGDKFLASMARYDSGTADDWAITPELSGDSQAVGFFARTFHGRFPESFEVLYSKSGTDAGDFVSLAKVEKVPYAWTEYSYMVPEGTKYVAVRHTTKGGFMLYLDDAVYTPAAGNGVPLTLEGYHVTADGEQVTESPVSATSFKLTGSPAKIEVYPVYAEGLGRAAQVDVVSGVDDIADAALKVAGGKGLITVSGCAGSEVSVISVTGVTVHRSTASESLTIPVAAGIYLVKVGQKVVKVSVR